MSFHLAPALLLGSFFLAAGAAVPAQDEPSAPAPAPAAPQSKDTESEPLPALAPGQVARVGEMPITDAEYLRYLGTVYGRLPEAEVAIQQELTERIVREAAVEARVSVVEADVEDLAARLDARARRETGGEAGLVESLGAEESELRRSLELLALQEKVIAFETGEQHPSDELLRDWMDERLEGTHVISSPLDDPIAARWEGGEISRVDLGRRLHQLLDDDERAGVLTELIGILLVREAAAQAGIELTPELIAEEIAQRDALVRSRSETAGVSYADIVEQMKKITLEELIASPGFGAEVLLRALTEQRWTEAQLRLLFEAEREAFILRLGSEATFEEALPFVWREVRQRSYRQLFKEGRIVRRF